MNKNIMKFGKYKGESIVDVIAKDSQYIEWLKKNNPTFNQQIMNINVIQENINIKKDSPEHNLMQVNIFNNINNIFTKERLFELKFFTKEDFHYVNIEEEKNIYIDIKKEIEKKYNNYYIDIFLNIYISCRTEKEQNDYFHKSPNSVLNKFDSTKKICIEIKPTIGDDFMDIIRQLSKYKNIDGYHNFDKFIVITKNIKCSNLSKDDVLNVFKSKKIKVLFYDDIFNKRLTGDTNE